VLAFFVLSLSSPKSSGNNEDSDDDSSDDSSDDSDDDIPEMKNKTPKTITNPKGGSSADSE
jgi:hypothetical protein